MSITTVKSTIGSYYAAHNTVLNSTAIEFTVSDDVQDSIGTDYLVFTDSIVMVPGGNPNSTVFMVNDDSRVFYV